MWFGQRERDFLWNMDRMKGLVWEAFPEFGFRAYLAENTVKWSREDKMLLTSHVLSYAHGVEIIVHLICD